MSWFYSPSFLLITLLVVLPEHTPSVIVIFQFIVLFSDKTVLRGVAQYPFPVSGKLNYEKWTTELTESLWIITTWIWCVGHLLRTVSITKLPLPHTRTGHRLNEWASPYTVLKKPVLLLPRIPTSGHRFQCVVSRSVVFLSMLVQLSASHRIVCIAVIPV